MPRFKTPDYGLKMIPVDFQRQVLPGSFEFALCHLVDKELDLCALRSRFRNDAAFLADSLIAQLQLADAATRATSYASPGGALFTSWRDTRVYPLLPGAQVSGAAPTVVFDATNPNQVTVTLKKSVIGTELNVEQEGIPAAIPVDFCYQGWQESLEHLARLVEPEIPD